MSSLFTKIINGEIPSTKIAEDDLFYAFLDIMPLKEGHTLVVPKLHIDKLYEAPENILQAYLSFAAPIAKAIEKAFTCQRVGMAVIGLEVNHAHLHLVPIDSAQDLNFTAPKMPMQSAAQLVIAQQKILAYLK
jgi:histidine triad (HIT) family protein